MTARHEGTGRCRSRRGELALADQPMHQPRRPLAEPIASGPRWRSPQFLYEVVAQQILQRSDGRSAAGCIPTFRMPFPLHGLQPWRGVLSAAALVFLIRSAGASGVAGRSEWFGPAFLQSELRSRWSGWVLLQNELLCLFGRCGRRGRLRFPFRFLQSEPLVFLQGGPAVRVQRGRFGKPRFTQERRIVETIDAPL